MKETRSKSSVSVSHEARHRRVGCAIGGSQNLKLYSFVAHDIPMIGDVGVTVRSKSSKAHTVEESVSIDRVKVIGENDYDSFGQLTCSSQVQCNCRWPVSRTTSSSRSPEALA